MRKIITCLLCAALLAPLFAVAGCTSPAARDEYEMQLEYFPEERKLTAEAEMTIYNRSDTEWKELKFQLWANAYREGAKFAPVSELYRPAAYYGGESYGGVEITSLQGGESYAVGGEDENILTVKLASPLYPDERVKLSVGYEVSLAAVNHRLGAGENAVTLSHFYPMLCHYDGGFREYVYSASGESFVNECVDFDVTLTVPETYRAAHNGEGGFVAQNGKNAYHVIAKNARDVAFVLSEKFGSVKKTADGVEVEYFYFNDENPELALGAAADSLAYYSGAFGKYAFPRYTLVQADFPYGGMEYSGFALISSDLRESEIPLVVAHETAHQWWYATVGSNQFECAWQDEGLAELSAALFLETREAGAYESAVKASESSYRAFFSVYSQVNGEANTAMNRPLTSFSGDYEYRNLAYDKGLILFSRLRGALGERALFGGLKKYVKGFGGKIASYADLVSCFPFKAEGIFDSFTSGKCVI